MAIEDLPVLTEYDFENNRLHKSSAFFMQYAEIAQITRKVRVTPNSPQISVDKSGLFYILGKTQEGDVIVMEDPIKDSARDVTCDPDEKVVWGNLRYDRVPLLRRSFSLEGKLHGEPYLLDTEDIVDYRALELKPIMFYQF